MLDNSMKEFFARQAVQSKIQVLAQLSFELTIAARDTYAAGTEMVNNPVRLRQFNEVQHQIAGYLCALVNGTERYPDEVFVQMILEHEDPRKGIEFHRRHGRVIQIH